MTPQTPSVGKQAVIERGMQPLWLTAYASVKNFPRQGSNTVTPAGSVGPGVELWGGIRGEPPLAHHSVGGLLS